MQYNKVEKPKAPTVTELKQRIGALTDERDGLLMRLNAYEAKINGLTQNLHQKEKIMAQLRAEARAADRLAMKVVRFVAADAREQVVSTPLNQVAEEIEGEHDL